MTTYYVASGITGNTPHPVTGRVNECGPDTADSVVGSDSNDGLTAATPFLTLAKLQTLNSNTGPASGDTVYIRGRFHQTTSYAYTMTDNSSGVTWKQWPDGEPAIIKGTIIVGTTGWTNTAGTFTKNITAGLTLAGVCWDYDYETNVDTTSRTQEGIVGRRLTWLPAKSAAALAGGAVVGYNYTSPTLTVVPPFGGDPSSPNANGIEYAKEAISGLGFVGSSTNDLVTTGIIVDGLTFQGFCGASSVAGSVAPLGCCVFIANGDNCVVKNCRFEDSGIHAVSFGSRVTSNTCMDNVYIGEKAPGLFIAFDTTGTTGGSANTVTGCQIIRDKFYVNGLLAADGAIANALAGAGAVVYHGTVGGVVATDIQIFEYTPTSGNPDSAQIFTIGNTTAPSTPSVPTSYGVKFVQTNPNIYVLYNSVGINASATANNTAYINCRFNFGQLKSSGLNRQQMYAFNLETGNLCFAGCTFEGDMGNGAGPIRMFSVGASSNVYTINCSGLDSGATHGAQKYSIFFFNGGGTINDYNSTWAFASTTTGTRYYSTGDAAVADTSHVINAVRLWNIGGGAGGTTFTENTSFNTDVEFVATFTNLTSANILSAAPFTSVAAGSLLVPTTTAKAFKLRLPVKVAQGVNQRVYDGTAGAYQFGMSGGHRLNRTTRAFRLKRV